MRRAGSSSILIWHQTGPTKQRPGEPAARVARADPLAHRLAVRPRASSQVLSALEYVGVVTLECVVCTGITRPTFACILRSFLLYFIGAGFVL